MVTKTKFNTLDGKDVTAIRLNSLSSAISTEGREPDQKWLKKVSNFNQNIERIENPKTVADKILKFFTQGGVQQYLGVANFASNPLLGLFQVFLAPKISDGVTSIIKFGVNNVALFKTGGIAALATAGGVALSFLTGTSPLQVLRGILNFTDTIYDFNFDTPDSAIWGQIKSTIDGLYGQAGDFLGSSFARLLLIGTLAPPKIEIDIDGIALSYNAFSEERREDLLNGISSFAYMGIRAAQRVSFLFALLNGRSAIKQALAASPGMAAGIDKLFPGLSKALAGWGDEENPLTKEEEVKDWRISTFVENKLEKVKDTYGPQIGNFIEQFFEGFTDELRDGLEEYIEYRFV